MVRTAIEKLVAWKNSPDRKPLILEGARQVGKTWLLKELGNQEYANFVYVNCDNNPRLENLFIDFDVNRIIRNLSAIYNTKIEPENTLIFFDEIQEMPKALTALKYFCEDAPSYHVVAAGSLLGLMMHGGTGFPVGKVDRLTLYPLSFMEFLDAMERGILAEQIRGHDWKSLNAMHHEIEQLLRQYYFTGGMPAVVASYVKKQDLKKVRSLQKSILKDYADDISKHASSREVQKISLVWNSIPSQLAKENKKFIYGAIKSGGRAKEFENAIAWLMNAGLVHKVSRVKKIEKPLKFYEDFDCFKLYINDVGLLGAMVDTPAADILVSSNAFSQYKGSFTEQFVLQQFFSSGGDKLYYYTNDNSTMEIDFVMQSENVFPIEVKAEENLKAKSLTTVLSENDAISGVRFSMSDYRERGRIVNVPLGFAEEYFKTL